MVELGDKVKDTVTGYQGIAIGATTWLHGCRRITVQSQELKDGKPVEAVTFDEPQLTVVKAMNHAAKRDTGGPGPVAEKRGAVTR